MSPPLLRRVRRRPGGRSRGEQAVQRPEGPRCTVLGSRLTRVLASTTLGWGSARAWTRNRADRPLLPRRPAGRPPPGSHRGCGPRLNAVLSARDRTVIGVQFSCSKQDRVANVGKIAPGIVFDTKPHGGRCHVQADRVGTDGSDCPPDTGRARRKDVAHRQWRELVATVHCEARSCPGKGGGSRSLAQTRRSEGKTSAQVSRLAAMA